MLETLFPSLSHARTTLHAWRNDYNLNRPHSRLGWLPPTAYADSLNQRRDLPLCPHSAIGNKPRISLMKGSSAPSAA
ncbi:integrase core domain-containing protein [Stappia indica]